METGNASQAFDAGKFALDLHSVLSQVAVSGAQNIHNMDAVLNGLIYLHRKLSEQPEVKAEEKKRETEEI